MSNRNQKISFEGNPNEMISILNKIYQFPQNQNCFSSVYDQAFQIMKDYSLYSASCESPDLFSKTGQMGFCNAENIFCEKRGIQQFCKFQEIESQLRPRKCSQFQQKTHQKLGDISQDSSVRKTSLSIQIKKNIMQLQNQKENLNKLQNYIQDDKIFVDLSKSIIQFLGYFNDQLRIVSFKCYKSKKRDNIVHQFKVLMTESYCQLLSASLLKQQQGEQVTRIQLNNIEYQSEEHPEISLVALQIFSIK